MNTAFTAADANRYFSKVLRTVQAGHSCTITSHGRPVARLVPVRAQDRVRAAAQSALLARLRKQRASGPVGKWTRDELYE
jgi:prevent-host-death family protein